MVVSKCCEGGISRPVVNARIAKGEKHVALAVGACNFWGERVWQLVMKEGGEWVLGEGGWRLIVKQCGGVRF